MDWLDDKLRLLNIQVNELSGSAFKKTVLGATSPIDLQPIPPTPAISAPNEIRNGDVGHSVNTWNETAPAPTADKGKECAFWFSNDAPFVGQALDETNALTSSTNQTLKAFIDDGGVHSTYDENYSDWDRARGIAELQGTTSIDAPLPIPVPPGRPFFTRCIIALKNSYIKIPSGFRLYAGLHDNTAGQRTWLPAKNPFTLSGEVRGTPTGTTERRYKIFAFTDRGYSFLSTEKTLVNAPDDASFNAGSDAYLSWTHIDGVLQYYIYRYDVASAIYRLLAVNGSGGLTYGDNNTTAAIATGYPTATDDRAKSYVATQVLTSIAVDGVAAQWDTLFLNIPAPSDYDQTQTTDKQWYRFGANKALDREVSDAIVTSGSRIIESATAAYTTLDVGRTVTLTKGSNTHSSTVSACIDATHLELLTPPTWSDTDATLYIVEGGDHGLLIDLIHGCYVSGSTFAPHPSDNRIGNGGQYPIAAPNGSSQGGIGSGGDIEHPGHGGIACVTLDTLIAVFLGDKIRAIQFQHVCERDLLVSGDRRGNQVVKIIRGTSDKLIRVLTENGIELVCSPSHRLITSWVDEAGRAVETLVEGDYVLTWIDGQTVRSRIKSMETLAGGEVGTFKLAPSHIYMAGRRRQTLWHRLMCLLGVRDANEVAGLMSHNSKQVGNEA